MPEEICGKIDDLIVKLRLAFIDARTSVEWSENYKLDNELQCSARDLMTKANISVTGEIKDAITDVERDLRRFSALDTLTT